MNFFRNVASEPWHHLHCEPTLRNRHRLAYALSVWVLFFVGRVLAAEAIPPKPADHFNDYAGLVSSEAASRLNSELTQFERDSSNQVVVAIYPRMQSNSSIEDYTIRVAQAWGVGPKDRSNGAVLFIFQQDRTMFIQVGYGLEGVLPDARCKQIIEDEIVPRFRAGDFQGGVVSGVNAMLASIRGEYQGSGSTVKEAEGRSSGGGMQGWMMIAVIIFIILQSLFGRRHSEYSRRGRRGIWMLPGTGSNWGGGRSGGGGSFSGGGGSFGGGGAGGRW